METVATTRAGAVVERRGDRPWVPAALAVGAWAVLIAIGHLWGRALNDSGADIALWAPPLFGKFDLRVGAWAVIPVAAAAAIVAAGPRLAAAAPWRALLCLAGLGAAGWALALAVTVGAGGVVDPLAGGNQYLTVVPEVGSPGEFLSTFTERIDGFTTHVRSHPPGMVLALWGLDALGLGGPWPAALLMIAIAGSATPAALLAMRTVTGESAARRAAPYLVLAPAAIWVATSADALFMGVGAWAVAATVLAIDARGRRSDLLAWVGGLLFGICLFLSYGMVLLAVIPLAVAISRRRLRPLTVAALATGAVVLAFAIAGFWWLDGFAAVREQYLASIARSRPYDFFLVANLAALGLAIGPAGASALALVRGRGAWLLVGGAIAAVAAADVSGMSKGEVERIWLPFVPWLLLATAALPTGPPWGRALLGIQGASAIAIQLTVRTPW
jgi:methylthioxylose transferase